MLPQSIQRSDIIFDEKIRARTVYEDIPELAQSIASNVGLIQPIVLSPIRHHDGTMKFLLDDGGRRLAACDALGYREFFLGATGEAGRPGFVLAAAELSGDVQLMRELTGNKFRQDFTWQEDMSLLVRAYRKLNHARNLLGQKLSYFEFGQMFGYSDMEIKSAMNVYEDVEANPADYVSCTGMQGAYVVKLNKAKRVVEAEAARRLQAQVSQKQNETKAKFIPTTETPHEKPQVIFPLSNYRLGNSIEFLESLNAPAYDAIITDPDFAISVDRLSSNSDTARLGVIQTTVESSLADLSRFILASFHALHDHGYLVFFYDLDHHEKLQSMCADAGFAVQRWPLIWHKIGFASNANPHKNTTKDIEYAMVASKSKAQLSKPGVGSCIPLPLANANEILGHPFAKPADLWRALFSRFVRPGYVVFDAFMGSGSMPLAALGLDFTVHGMELNPDHYNRCLLNLKGWAETNLGSDVQYA